MTADVAVIVVTYNSAAYIRSCLDSVCSQGSELKLQIVVVDNASTDETTRIIRGEYPDVELLKSEENLGFARGVNFGAQHGDAEFILLLNPDARVSEGAIDKLVRFARTNPEYGVYGGRALKGDGSLEPSSCWAFPTLWSMAMFSCGLSTLFPGSRWLNPERMPQWERDTIREVGFVSGCFLLVTVEVWKQLGGLDERYFMYGEDADFGLRARAAGYRSVICPEATVTHEIGASSATKGSKLRLLFRGKATLIRTHWRGGGRSVALFFLVAGAWLRASLAKVGMTFRGRSAEGWRELWQTRREWIAGY